MAISRLTQTTLQNAFQKFNTVWDGTSAVGGMDQLGSIAVSSATAASISFVSIPQTYTHLQIRGVGRSTSTSANLTMQLNADTSTSSYTYHAIYSDGATIVGGGAATGLAYNFVGYVPQSASTANTFGTTIVEILDYTNTNKNKTHRALAGSDMSGSGLAEFLSGAWLSTAAVTRIDLKISNGANNFAQYSSFALYGIK